MKEETLIDVELIKLKERQTNQLNCDLFEKCCKLQNENTELKQIISSIEEYCNENYKEACNYYDAWQFKLSGNGKDADIAYEKRELLGEILEILRGNNNVKN